MAGAVFESSVNRVVKFKPSSSNHKKRSRYREWTQQRKVGMKPAAPSGQTDHRLVVRSVLEKFEQLRRECPRSKNLSSMVLKKMIKEYSLFILNKDHREGSTPGVEVGDCFRFRAELYIVGLHRQSQAGIDWVEYDREDGHKGIKAVSIVSSGEYEDDEDCGDTIIYTGAGGKDVQKSKKQVEDQELTNGNTALLNSKRIQNSIRVIRARKDENSPSKKVYSYAGLFKVVDHVKEKGKSGFYVYKFTLDREQGQVPHTWNIPRELGSKSTLGLKQRQKAVVAGAEVQKKGGIKCSVGRGQNIANNDGGDRGHGSHSSLERSGAAGKLASILRERGECETERGKEKMEDDGTGIPGNEFRSGGMKGRPAEAKGRKFDGDGDEDEDGALVFARSKRARGEPSGARGKAIVDDFEEGVLTTREDLYSAKLKVFKENVVGDRFGMIRTVGNAKKWRFSLPRPRNAKAAVAGREGIEETNVANEEQGYERMGNRTWEGDASGRTHEFESAATSMTSMSGTEDSESEDASFKNKMDDSSYERNLNEDGVYTVERILRRRPRCGGKAGEEYLVLWKGYAREEATWEPRENLINCKEALADFERLRSNRKHNVGKVMPV